MLHPYYKHAYIKIAWGGPEEQAKEIAAGSPYAKDWQDEAKKIVERTVSSNSIPVELVANEMIHILHRWWSTIETAHVSLMELATSFMMSPMLPFCQISTNTVNTSSPMMRRKVGPWSSAAMYLSSMQRDVKKNTDLVEWWQVSRSEAIYNLCGHQIYVGPCKTVPVTRSHRPQCTSITSLVSPM